jgi:two-component system, chemotaxis family, CheB/CheR fusion protein
VSESAPVPAAAPTPPQSITPRRVMIVDDNHDAADSISALLALHGHETHVVYAAKAALNDVVSFRPDVILLDIGLPEMNGYEVARQLRATPGFERTCIIALTGYGHSDDQRQARAAGFTDHLVKPVDFNTLARAIAGAAVGIQ